ncbi:FG-GAP-like repeat-containing protein [Desulfoplanes sp. PS50]
MILRLTLILFCLLSFSPQALAEEARTFAVAPFGVHGPQTYSYLQQGIPSMLQTRLTWPGHFSPVSSDVVKEQIPSPVTGLDAAAKGLAGLQADYLVYGSVTIMGKECSLDVQLMNKEGTTTPFASQTTIDQLIPSLETTAKQINGDVFKRPEEKPAQQTNTVNQMNPNLVINQATSGQEVYLNPNIKYQATSMDNGRWRSQSLNFVSQGMVIGDADNDGVNEIFIIGDHFVHAYVHENNRLMAVATYEGPISTQNININLLDTNRDGLSEIIVSSICDKEPRSFILNYNQGSFTEIATRIPLFLNVIRTPPDFMPTLLGQKQGVTRIFKPGVHEVIKMSGEYSLGRRLDLPDQSNVFSVAFLPENGDYKIIRCNSHDHLEVYSSENNLQAATSESYASSSLGLEISEGLPGLPVPEKAGIPKNYYFVPSRLLPINLDKDDRFELLVGHNISVASQFFNAYRSFAQGEIHTLFWDGIGLNLAWKTRRIKGSIIDYAIADTDNDGNEELVICILTHPGATGLGNKRTMLLSYPLELTPHN